MLPRRRVRDPSRTPPADVDVGVVKQALCTVRTSILFYELGSECTLQFRRQGRGIGPVPRPLSLLDEAFPTAFDLTRKVGSQRCEASTKLNLRLTPGTSRRSGRRCCRRGRRPLYPWASRPPACLDPHRAGTQRAWVRNAKRLSQPDKQVLWGRIMMARVRHALGMGGVSCLAFSFTSGVRARS